MMTWEWTVYGKPYGDIIDMNRLKAYIAAWTNVAAVEHHANQVVNNAMYVCDKNADKKITYEEWASCYKQLQLYRL